MVTNAGATGDDAADTNAGVSRRDALRKLGVAAGVAWTAPVVLSFSNAAGAQVGSAPPTTPSTSIPPVECLGATCATYTPCTPENPDCICAKSSTGEVHCVPGSTPCDSLATCGPGGTCPPFFFCAIDSCCTEPPQGEGPPRNVCVPLALIAACPPPPADIAPSERGTRVKTGAGTLGG